MIALHAVHSKSSISEVRQMGGRHQSYSSFVSSDTSRPVSMHTDAQTPQKLLSGLYQGWTYYRFVKCHDFGAWHLEYEFNLSQSF